MSMNINPVYVNYQLHKPVFKSKNEDTTISNPIKQDISFKGTEALAAYNYALVNKDNTFNIPIIEPLYIPQSVEEIKGERIYNSAGKLIRIIDENEQYKTEYRIEDNKLEYYRKTEKDTNIKWSMVFNEGNFTGVSKKLPSGEIYFTDYENGAPINKSKYIYYSDGNDLDVSFDIKKQTYLIQKHYTKGEKQYSSFADFDKNKKCICAFESEGMHNEMTDLYFKKGEPYLMNTSKSSAISNILGKDIDLSNLEPSEFYPIDFEAMNKIEGDKTFYSNGQIEKIIALDGTIYNFELDGLKSIENPNKKIEIFKDDDGNFIHENVVEYLDDGGIKRTYYKTPNRLLGVDYKNKISSKSVSFYENGNLSTYSNKQEGQKEINRDYDENGNMIRCWDEE